jgi:hypothetical protein
LGESVGSPDSRQILRNSINRGMALLMRRPAVVRILVDESARPGPRLDFLYASYLGPLNDILSRFLAESGVPGIRDIDSRVAALFVLSAASAPFTHGALAEKMGLENAAPGAYTEALVDLVLGGLMTSSPNS